MGGSLVAEIGGKRVPGPEQPQGAPWGRREAEAFLYREARLLDERRFEDWLAMFTPDGRYWIPGGDSDDPGAEPAIVDDDRPTLEDRIRRLRSPVSFAQLPPSRTVRLVGNVELETALPAEARVRAVGIVHEYRAGQARAFATRCGYVLRRSGEGDQPWRIAEKRVRLLNYDQPLYNLTFLL